MSVVNKMLKDLEQREGNRVYEADYVPLESNSARSRRFIVGASLIVVVTAIVVWFLLPSEEKEATILAKAPLSNLTILPTNATQGAENVEEKADTVNMQDLDATTVASLSNSAQDVSAGVNEEAKPKTVLESATLAQKVIQTAPVETVTASPAIDAQLEIVQTKAAQPAKITEPEPVAPAAKETKQAEGVFSVSSNTKSTSNNRMLEQQIQLSLQNGDTPAAIRDLNELISLEPRNVSARKRLASLLFANGDPVRAAMLLHQGLKLSPEDSSMRLMQARLLFREKKNIQALALLKEHPATVIADDELLSFRAALAEKQSDYQTSHEDYSTLLQRQPNNARWMLGLAISQDKQLMHEQAVENYKKVKSSNQLSAQVLSFVDGRLAVLAGS